MAEIMWRTLYNCLLPVGFAGFLPGLLWKYHYRGGWKKTFAERFGRFTPERVEELRAFHGAVWIHSVSVGETVAALSLIRAWSAANPQRKFVISTTTTTGQEIARKAALPGVTVIFCPIDFPKWVRQTFDVVQPAMLAIFETEIWPNLLCEAESRKVPAVLLNARMSDHSVKGYYRFRCFFRPLLEKFTLIAAQSEQDGERFRKVSPQAHVEVFGNVKFDQSVPENLQPVDFHAYFQTDDPVILMGASTHPGEEALLISAYTGLKKTFPALKLVLVPRHAERGGEVASLLDQTSLRYVRRSLGQIPGEPVDVVLADTTGEMLALMKGADLIVMGKSLAGQTGGHNPIEPALLDKPVVCGAKMTNFRFVQNVLREAGAVVEAESDAALVPLLMPLIASAESRRELGLRAGAAIRKHAGAIRRIIDRLEILSADAAKKTEL
ncbi:MAG: 3-deoxy-D-manno-octulosonic acid transferase [Lentisphaeria bacterium]|nr:3-deoxy-D-manno-octulosonic acid transferase [Lentisphaeria bacterium]